jgi:glycosyltransferase involved in cell wall biosynthesis
MVDVLLVSLGTTGGLRTSDWELERSLRSAGASVAAVAVPQPSLPKDRPLLPALPRADFRWARAARRVTRLEVASRKPQAVIYSTVTAALFAPVVGAVRFDSTTSFNRPGPTGIWERPFERRRLRQAPLLVPYSAAALRDSPCPDAPAVVVPIPVDESGPVDGERDVAAVTYGYPAWKKGLDRVLAAWHEARRPGENLLVAGTEETIDEPGVEVVGRLPRDQFRSLLRRTRVFIAAPRREDYGIVQLEALTDGCVLATTPSHGPYVARDIARRIDPRLVGDDLGSAIRVALDEPRPDYLERARAELAPFRRSAVDEVVAKELLPRLLSEARRGD